MRLTIICAAVLYFVFDRINSEVLAVHPNIVLIMTDDMVATGIQELDQQTVTQEKEETKVG